MFSETARRSPATLTDHHHQCYFGARAETCKCSTLMSVGIVLCSGAERGQVQPRAGSGLGEGAELQRRWCQCILHLGRKSCSFSSPHMCNSQRYRGPVLLFLCEVLCQLCMAALVSVSVGASREASKHWCCWGRNMGQLWFSQWICMLHLWAWATSPSVWELFPGFVLENQVETLLWESTTVLFPSFVFSPVLPPAPCWVWRHFVSDLLRKLSASVFKCGMWLLPLPRLRKSWVQPARKP